MTRHEKALALLHRGTVIPANPLALDANREFSPAGQRLLTRYYLEAGAGGIAVAVHTTQFEIRQSDIALFEPVLEVAVREIEAFENETGKTIVRVAGVCGPLEQAVSEAKTAARLGYDAVLLSPGGLNHLSEDEMLRRTEAVAAVMPVIGFYLQPAVGGKLFSYDYWVRLCAVKNVVAIKCASFHRYSTLDVVRAAAFSERSDEIALYTGNDDNIVIDLMSKYKFTSNGKTYEKGFVGGLLGHWSVWTKRAVEIFDRLRSGSINAENMILANEVTDTNAAFFDTANNFAGCIAGLHEVLYRQGLMETTYCLNPDEKLSPGQLDEINRIYDMYPHLNDDDFVRNNLAEWKRGVAERMKNDA